ncbi:hypothetical protein [Acidicapsa acidisoli]|uniref:hypothetical protein n=1 Tax=Acidicapsa acidisoli TaxID=1615681 RepID=UPI0021E0B414|nr:hypothetical protein [Acidicapsa acidisoli]
MRQVHEVVRLSRSVGGVPKGTSGTIMMTMPDETSCCLVEFPDPEGKEIILVSIREDDLEKAEFLPTPEDLRLWSKGWEIKND